MAAVPSTKSEHLAAIDGLRGVAVLSVMAFHANLLIGGYLGVDLFFTLSGFLITRLLLIELHTKGEINLPRFWLRRARRLLPALFATLAGTALLVWKFGEVEDLEHLRRGIIGAVTYSNNWLAIGAGSDYWSASGRIDPVGHLWSLAIEEQFYLVFPIVMVLLARNRKRLMENLVMVGVIGTIASMSLAAMLVTPGKGITPVYLGTHTRVAAILIGCTLAALRPVVDNGVVRKQTSDLARGIIGVMGVGVMGLMWWKLPFTSLSLFRGGLLLQGLAAVAVLIALAPTPAGPFKILGTKPVVWLGQRSYAIYLIHLPFFWYLSLKWPVVGTNRYRVLGFGTAGTILLATIVHVIIENPFRFKVWRPITAAPTYVIAAVGVLALGIIPLREYQIHVSSNSETARKVAASVSSRSAIPVTQRKPVVLILGDSTAEDAFHGMDDNMGAKYDIVGSILDGCALVTADKIRVPDPFDQTDACHDWRGRYQDAIDKYRPDVAILTNVFDAGDHLIGGNWIGPCTPEFATLHRKAIADVDDLFAKAKIPLVLTQLADHSDHADLQQPWGCLNRNFEAVAKERNLPIVPLGDRLCARFTCPFEAVGNPLFRDYTHFTPEGRKWSSGIIDEILTTQVLPALNLRQAATATTAAPAGR